MGITRKKARALYDGRRLAEGYPNLEALGTDLYKDAQVVDGRVREAMDWILRIVPVTAGAPVAVVGCGPRPQGMRELTQMGYRPVGVEPLRKYVHAARSWLKDENAVLEGTAERLPLGDASQCVIILETVLEHVDSLQRTFTEAYRALAPGGILYVLTVNRFRWSWTGKNPEFNVPFYNWFPALLKEAYVHHHLHFDPRLANFTPRPAVHWPSYADLCAFGRQAGFHRFYSKVDVLKQGDPSIAKSRLRCWLLNRVRYNPWLRALALLQFGDSIFMLKRRDT